ncbi:UDP-glucose 4-epimerase GalE [Virgibacillus halodenitrificans]|uniref:UDP-glucose 4-epimerase GalE n=1 Tax=Virgibacillus halodenitrificans TaxID=1482 RepID=UPI0013686C59|nr:UDP-glucose 4-epimerase GalE [Virgibacillus halodenitrificans]MYL47788.1 UDP-glucose 4-epimerase GalE [Virgibacillus halodenitrificans]
MTILLTGGAGYIGSHAAIELLNNDYDIVLLDSLKNSSKEAVNRIKQITGKDFPFHKFDLLNKEKLEELFQRYNFSSVIHFAGLKAVGESVEHPLDYYENNIMSTINLCRVMKKHNVKKLVFSSSATVYGNPEQVPIVEDFPLSSTNPYGRTKLMIEEILQDLVIADSSWRIAILRYFNPIGAHESGLIGEDPKETPNNLMPYITQVAVGKREKLSVFGDDYETNDGTGVRDFIHVVDLVRGHIAALNYLEEHKGVEFFNLGTGKGYSVLELVTTFEEVTGENIPYEVVDRRKGDIAECYADPSKARNFLKWEAEKNLKDMCKDSWKWQLNNPNGYEVK